MKYIGYALNSTEFDSGRKSGDLVLQSGFLTFNWESGSIKLPFKGMQISMGGAGKRLIYFSHSNYPDWHFYCTDRKVLKDPALSNHPACMDLVSALRFKQRLKVGLLGGILVAIVSFIMLFLASIPWLVKTSAEHIPVQWEEELGKAAFESHTEEMRIIDDPYLNQELKKMTDPLVKAVGSKEYTFRFHILEDPTINAFALPGGYVAINTGLIFKAERAEEIAGVVAHEIGHVIARHGMRKMVSQVGIFVLLQAFVGDAGALLETLAHFGGSLVGLKYSRDFEDEADQSGWTYMVDAGIDPRGMIDFFKIIQEEQGAQGEIHEHMDFLTTHPATSARIEVLESKWEALNPKPVHKPIDIDMKKFKEILRDRLNEDSSDSPGKKPTEPIEEKEENKSQESEPVTK